MAAAGNIEALWAIKFRHFVEVSVQRMAGGRGWGEDQRRWGCLRPGHTHCPFWHQSCLTVTAVGMAAGVASSGMRSSLSSTTVSAWLLQAVVVGEGWGGYCSRAELSLLLGLAYLQAAWPVRRTIHSMGVAKPTGAWLRSTRRWPGSRIS